jgi:hypothetical protein
MTGVQGNDVTRSPNGVDEAWHLAHLRIIDSILQGMNYRTHLLEKSASIPQPVLLVKVALPGKRAPLEMALGFYPVDPHQVKHTLLLQYFTELPLSLDEGGIRRVRELLPDLNSKTVLGHFSVHPGRSAVTYRYVQALPVSEPITQLAVADVMILVGYTPVLFIELLDAVTRNILTVEEARAKLAAQ